MLPIPETVDIMKAGTEFSVSFKVPPESLGSEVTTVASESSVDDQDPGPALNRPSSIPGPDRPRPSNVAVVNIWDKEMEEEEKDAKKKPRKSPGKAKKQVSLGIQVC